jgi:hypothetical protein
MDGYKEEGECFVHNAPQMTEKWAEVRGGTLPYSTLKECRGKEKEEIFERIDSVLDISKIDRRLKGIWCESIARAFLSLYLFGTFRGTFGYSIDRFYQIHQWGSAISKSCRYFSASVDGVVYDQENPSDFSIVEIKCPYKLYTNGTPLHHMEQMQWNMMVTGSKQCHYYVFESPSRTFYHLVKYDHEMVEKLKDEAYDVLRKCDLV